MNLNQLVCIGLSHQTAPVELRERFSNWSELRIDNESLGEVVILSTCNRMEVYACLTTEAVDGRAVLVNWFAKTHAIDPSAFVDHLYCYTGLAVVEHLCRVASGLESLVLGEAQILGQVNHAWQSAQAAKTLGPALTLLFRVATRNGKRTHHETAIGSHAISLSSVALTLAHQVTGDLRRQRVLLVGLGEMGQLALKGLRARGVQQVGLVNRTLTRAQAMAAEWGGEAIAMADLPQALRDADVVISATSAPEPILDAAMVAAALADRQERRLALIDLAVPRDIDPAVADLPGVHLFDVDDLRGNLDAAWEARQREIPHVEAIIAEELANFQREFHELSVRPVVMELRQKAEAIRQREVARTLRSLGQVDPALLPHLQQLSQALVNHLLHEPTAWLKTQARQQQGATDTLLVREIFGLGNSGG